MPSACRRSASNAAAASPASSRSYAISTRFVPFDWNAANSSSVNPFAPKLDVTLRMPAHQNVNASINASHRITSSHPAMPARLNTPRCGPGRYRCSAVPGVSFAAGVILRPYSSATAPDPSNTGTTNEPLKCSCPLSRNTPNACSRSRIVAPALRLLAGSRSPSVRLAKPKRKWSTTSG